MIEPDERGLEQRMAARLSARFKMSPPPSVAVPVAKGHVVLSRLRNTQPREGMSTPQQPDEAISFLTPLMPARFLRATIDGKPRPFVQVPGQTMLSDLNSVGTIDLQTRYDNVRFYFSRTALDALSYDKGLRRIGGLRPGHFDDPFLYHVTAAVAPMLLRAGEAGAAFVEHLALAVHEHIVRTYADQPNGAPAARGGLTPWQLRRVRDYVEANLDGDPSIAALSQECGLSQSYFVKAFGASLGMSPHRWITHRRVERAKTLMLHSDHSLVEIAMLCGFADQSHFGQVFARLEGESPARWRRLRRP